MRQIVKIDEELCNGCGACVTPCAEGAIVLVDGKAKTLMHERGQVYITQRCFRCETGEDEAPLVPVRHQGQSMWVCTRCLPALIHG
jgi:ferredoxin